MDLILYLTVIIAAGIIRVAAKERSAGFGPAVSQPTAVSMEAFAVGSNVNGICHKDAFMKIIKELEL